MESVSADRDHWMRRTGPLYPLLVAALMQTRLPVARTLTPSARDEVGALPWLSVVGLAMGLALSAASYGLSAVGLGGPAAAALLAVAILLAGGFWGEHALLRVWSAFADRRGMRFVDLSLGVIVAVALVLRTGFLMSTPAGSWIAALMVSAMMSRLAASVVLARGDDRGEIAEPPWVAVAVMGFVVFCASVVLLGALALLVGLATAITMAAFARRTTGSAPDRAATAALVTELAVLLLVAARG